MAGEDDTERDIRLAREDVAAAENAKTAFRRHDSKKGSKDAPITDHAGHISLFAPAQPSVKDMKNAEAEAEKARKERELEDQYTMRFSNAAGFKNGMQKPWYSEAGKGAATEEIRQDVWGNADPLRKQRDANRVSTSDPLAFMKRAQVQLKDAERDRKKWAEERQRELRALEEADEKERRRENRSKRHRDSRPLEDGDSLEGFSLDAPAALDDESEKRRRPSHHSSRHRRHRSRSRESEHRSHRGSRRRDESSGGRRDRPRHRDHIDRRDDNLKRDRW